MADNTKSTEYISSGGGDGGGFIVSKPKKRKARRGIPKEEALVYKSAYIANGFNQVKACKVVKPMLTDKVINAHASRYHKVVEKGGYLKDFTVERKRIIQKAWKKVDKALEKNTDKADSIAKDLAVKDIRDSKVDTVVNVISPNLDSKQLKNDIDRLLEARNKGA